MTRDLPYETTFAELSPLQARIAVALARGGSVTEVAASFGIHRVTIYRWMKTLRPFETAVEQGRSEYVLALRDDLRELSERALQTLSAVLDDPTASAAARSRVAMFILKRPQFPKQDWALPVNIAAPEERDLEPDSPLIAEDERRMRELEAQLAAESQAAAGPEPAAGPCTPAEPEPAPVPEATQCNEMQRDAEIFEPGPATCPPPPAPWWPEAAEPAPAASDATQCNEMHRDAEIFAPAPQSPAAPHIETHRISWVLPRPALGVPTEPSRGPSNDL